MKRRQFLQNGITATALVSLYSLTGYTAEPTEQSAKVISLIHGRTWTQLGTMGRLIVYDDKVYCEHQEKLRGGMTMVIRGYGQAKADLASGKIAKQVNGNKGIDKFLSYDAEGKLIVVNELSDATKWHVGTGNGEPYKQYRSDRDDRISGASLQHAVGFNKKFFLGLAPEVETRKVKNRSKQDFERNVQQLVLEEKPDENLALWINDFSGK